MKTALVDFLAERRSRESAQKELTAFIAEDPQDYPLRFALGQFYEQGKDFSKAKTVYQDVIGAAGLEAPGITARNRLAALLVQQNDYAAAEKLIAEVLAKSPRDNDALILRGNLALTHKDPKAAVTDLRAVLRDQPNAVGVMRSLARAHLANGEPALAEETMRRAVEANPQDPAARMDLAQLLIKLGKPAQAAPVIDALVREQPNNLAALDAQFKIAVTGKDWVLAKSAADAIVALQPKGALGYYYQGAVAESKNQSEEALRLYSTALDMLPQSAEPLEALTRLLVRMKRVPEALKKLDDAIAAYPTLALAANLKARYCCRRSMRRMQCRPSRWPSGASRHGGFPTEILRRLKPSARTTRRRSRHCGTVWAKPPRRMRWKRNSRDCMSVPASPMMPLRSTKRPFAAIRRRTSRPTIWPCCSSPIRRIRAAWIGAKQLAGRFATSSNGDFLDTYGWVLYKRGEGAAAVAALQTALIKTPDSPVSLYHLGMAQAQVGQTEAARDSLNRSLSTGKSFSGMDEAKAALNNLAKLTSTGIALPKS